MATTYRHFGHHRHFFGRICRFDTISPLRPVFAAHHLWYKRLTSPKSLERSNEYLKSNGFPSHSLAKRSGTPVRLMLPLCWQWESNPQQNFFTTSVLSGPALLLAYTSMIFLSAPGAIRTPVQQCRKLLLFL